MEELIEVTKEFDYTQIDIETAEFLKLKVSNIREAVGSAETKVGKELHEGRSKLSKHGYGCFEEWYTSLNLKKNKVYDLINRYELIVGNSNKRELLEGLPLSLSYEVAKSSADPELKKQVLDGEIDSLKEWKKKVNQLEMRAKAAEGSVAKLSEKLEEEMNKPVITKTVEKLPADYEETKRKNVEIQKKLDKAEEDAVNSFRANLLEKDRYVIHDTLSTFVQTVGKHVKKLEFEVTKHPGDREIQRDINAAIETLKNAIVQMESWTQIKNMQRREVIIDANFTS